MPEPEIWGVGAIIRLDDPLAWTPMRYVKPEVPDHAIEAARDTYQKVCRKGNAAITSQGFFDFLLSSFLGALHRDTDRSEISFWLMLMAKQADLRYWTITITSAADSDCILQAIAATSPDDAIRTINTIIAEMEAMPIEILRARFEATLADRGGSSISSMVH